MGLSAKIKRKHDIYLIVVLKSCMLCVGSRLVITKDWGVAPGSLLCQVGDDVIRPCKICVGCQIRASRFIHSINVVPYNLDSNL